MARRSKAEMGLQQRWPHTLLPVAGESAQLLKIIVELAKVKVSSSSFDINSDILMSKLDQEAVL